MSDSLAPDDVVPLLHGRFGRPYRYAEECPSTQRLLAADLPEGAVAAADHQTEGRGRLGRRWQAPPRTSVLASVLLRPPVDAARLPEVSVLAAEAVADAIARVTGLRSAVKHPNDVLLRGRKVAGVLGEARDGVVVLGFGINVNLAPQDLPLDTRLPATSLLIETGAHTGRAAVLAAVLERLEQRYDAWVTSIAAEGGPASLVDSSQP